MKLKKSNKKKRASLSVKNTMQNERAMIEGILEGSPEAIGVAVIRLECGCKKMAAVALDGEPASKVIIYRDQASEVCNKCKEDNGAFSRVTESFIHWEDTTLEDENKQKIELKVLGNMPPAH